MSAPQPCDPRFERAAMSDETLLSEHERILGKQPDDRAHYRLQPLVMLFVLSGCVLFAATYLNRYSGHFDSSIYNENVLPTKGVPAEVKVDPVALGKRLFNTPGYCVTCHQANGMGVPATYPPLAGSEWVNGSEDRLIRIVLYGLQGSVHVEGKDFNATVMPVFGQVSGSGFNLSDDKIAAVLTYIRQEWGNKAGPVAAEDVSKIRAAVGQDHKSWTQDELLQIK